MTENYEKDFVPYEPSLDLKELEFDELCIKYYWTDGMFTKTYESPLNHNKRDNLISAPLYQQAFRWFREKYGLYHSIGLDNSLEDDVNCDYQIINHNQSISELETNFKSYEEAELECLKKLIEIVKQQL
jgi:hypothetical protein